MWTPTNFFCDRENSECALLATSYGSFLEASSWAWVGGLQDCFAPSPSSVCPQRKGVDRSTPFIVAGVWLAIGHVATALACFVTIIGIPFGIQHLKLAMLALAPVGKTIVTRDTADASRLYAAQAAVARQRS